MEKIDFIIPWVDGNDPEWIVQKKAFSNSDENLSCSKDANSSCRFRDNGLLRFWFRGVESFTPWINKVYFITCGQKPSWLNLNHPKLVWVKHSDYIPSQYLPTFNSVSIEMNFHRIAGLSERFVYFNDDMFLLEKIEPGFFFRKSQPVLDCDLRYTNLVGYDNWSRHLFNDYCLVNGSFNMHESIWNNRKKWFSIKELGFKRAGKNFLCFLANKSLPVGLYGHNAMPHLKSTFQEIWNRFPDIMDRVSSSRFRSDYQVNQWLACAWNQAKGSFQSTNATKRGIKINIEPDTLSWIKDIIQGQRYPLICLNESELFDSPEQCMDEIVTAFEQILPNKSSFEL